MGVKRPEGMIRNYTLHEDVSTKQCWIGKVGLSQISVSDELLSIMLFSSFSDDYEHFTVAIESSNAMPTLTSLNETDGRISRQLLLSKSGSNKFVKDKKNPKKKGFFACVM